VRMPQGALHDAANKIAPSSCLRNDERLTYRYLLCEEYDTPPSWRKGRGGDFPHICFVKRGIGRFRKRNLTGRLNRLAGLRLPPTGGMAEGALIGVVCVWVRVCVFSAVLKQVVGRMSVHDTAYGSYPPLARKPS
jgi:hypothetical protein